MPKIILEGWEVGMKKISFTKLIHENAGLGLMEAKSIKDRLVNDGEVIILVIEGKEEAESLLKKIKSFGVKARIETET